ncbi:OmpL47-type beta-barrel domain-containing protein [Treponema phagedenis]|uniref:OmpL47-type beta-barrel domain-containing protein n=2 Tax=Treponema phagedenis TaxID=162 RepID=UPI0021CCDA6C|nr:hypothetical protein [Treponema phagedenis]
MIKKTLLGTACAVFFFSAWAQAPQTIGTDYQRVATHYSDGKKEFVNSDVFFKLNASDKETGLDFVEFSLDGTKFMRYKNPFQILEEGAFDISYRGLDNSRNLEVPKTLSVVVDNTPPKAEIETTEPVYRKGLTTYCSANTKWYVSASDNLTGAGVAGTYIGTNLQALELRGKGKEAEDAYFSFESEGPAKLYYTALDNVGNLTPIALTSVIVDMTPPVIYLENSDRLINKEAVYTVFPSDSVVDAEGRIIVSTSEAIAFGAKDELSGLDAIYIKINDAEYTKYVEPIKFNTEDVYTIEVKAIDNVGNVSEPVTYTFYVDKINPASSVEMIDRSGNKLDTITPDGTIPAEGSAEVTPVESDIETAPAEEAVEVTPEEEETDVVPAEDEVPVLE